MLLAEIEDLLQRVVTLLPAIREVDLLRRYVVRVELLDVPVEHRSREGISIDDLPRHLLLVPAEGSGSQADDLRFWKPVEHLAPARRDVVMSFVDEDHREEVRRELRQPAVRGT